MLSTMLPAPLLTHARQNGVEYMCLTNSCIAGLRCVLCLATAFSFLSCTIRVVEARKYDSVGSMVRCLVPRSHRFKGKHRVHQIGCRKAILLLDSGAIFDPACVCGLLPRLSPMS